MACVLIDCMMLLHDNEGVDDLFLPSEHSAGELLYFWNFIGCEDLYQFLQFIPCCIVSAFVIEVCNVILIE